MPRRCRSPTASFDAVTIAFGIRNVPRIETALAEAHRVLQARRPFPLPGIFHRRPARPGRALRALFVQRDPGARPAVAGDAESYRYLVESIRRFPRPRGIRRHDARGRLRARLVPADDRRHRGAAFRLALVITCVRPISPVSPAPASCSRAKACWRWSIRSRCRCRRGMALRVGAADRAADRDGARAPAGRGADAARPDLCEARTVPGDAARRRRRRARARSRIAAGQDAAVPASRGRSASSPTALGKPLPATSVVASARRSRPRPSRRSIAPRSRLPTAPRTVAVKVLRPGIERRFAADLDAFTFAARKAEKLVGRSAAPAS